MRITRTIEETKAIFKFAYDYSCDDSIKQGEEDINMTFSKCLEKILGVVYSISWNKITWGYMLTIESIMLKKDYRIELFFKEEDAEIIINKYAFPKLKMKFSKEEVIEYLINYQKWRRGANVDMPDVTTIGYIIDEAIKLLKEK